ncbi:RdgB/HAM1 family non-canonical purine NTP pyrophosphatase [Oscillospiraceae bacterium OttesenSCG-928-G22]|nr:RdgB/HAM1 family non-canonical purine NTP pyrophosphatase [Oscillospiraceae bacterium OttesenSCG-928-G22]
MKLVAATNNQKKLIELRALLTEAGVEVLSLADSGYTKEIPETGTTFLENAFQKARTIMDVSGLPAIADDSGLEVEALGGDPGVYSARYGGDACKTDADRNALLLRNMEGKGNRNARFVSAIACVFPDGTELSAIGTCEGILLEAPRGDGGFGYDPLFLFPDLGKTMAEISAELKNKISHRANAMRLFFEQWKGIQNA